MNRTLLAEIIRVCRQREHDGDRPTVPAFSVEILEGALTSLAYDVARLADAAERVLAQWQPVTIRGCQIGERLDDALHVASIVAARKAEFLLTTEQARELAAAMRKRRDGGSK